MHQSHFNQNKFSKIKNLQAILKTLLSHLKNKAYILLKRKDRKTLLIQMENIQIKHLLMR